MVQKKEFRDVHEIINFGTVLNKYRLNKWNDGIVETLLRVAGYGLRVAGYGLTPYDLNLTIHD